MCTAGLASTLKAELFKDHATTTATTTTTTTTTTTDIESGQGQGFPRSLSFATGAPLSLLFFCARAMIFLFAWVFFLLASYLMIMANGLQLISKERLLYSIFNKIVLMR
jgi:hypothetical protein